MCAGLHSKFKSHLNLETDSHDETSAVIDLGSNVDLEKRRENYTTYNRSEPCVLSKKNISVTTNQQNFSAWGGKLLIIGKT